ncbi:MAG: glycosyltransferase family 2 protein [Nitrospirae bacterium]|nr:glycosyltransferase family 2 protein [Nitrospirota bacterium]
MEDKHYPHVTIIILNWNGKDDTIECLKSVEKINYADYDILLIDNGSDDDSVKVFKNLYHNNPRIRLIENEKNLGFAEGNNIGIREALKRGSDYILLLNNDTVVKDDFLGELVKVGEEDKRYGIIGPKIYFWGVKKIIYAAGGGVIGRLGQPLLTGLLREDRGQYDKEGETGFITGCALLIRREAVEKTGLLDEDYFFFFEDLDWNIRAKREGFLIAYAPKSIVWHRASSAVGFKSPNYYYYMTRNRILFVRKNFSVFSFIFLFLPYFIFYRYLWLITKLSVNRKWEHVRAVNRGVWWHFG